MKHTTALLAILLISILFVFGCTPPAPPGKTLMDATGVTAENVNLVVNANNQFAFDLYAKYKSNEGNIFFSPYSISSALAMTYEGARGQTAQEIANVFHFPLDTSQMRPAFAQEYNNLNAHGKPYLLNTANALWAQQNFKFLDSYFATIGNYYGGKVTNLDFVGDTENSRVTINKWVEQQTNDKIKDLIPQGEIDPMTRLVLTNAIYFKGTWLWQFEKSATREADFRVSPELTVKAQMMAITGEKARFNYAETDELQILELPYSGNELSMLLLLPKADTLDALEGSFTLEKLIELRAQMYETGMKVYLPKFKFETKYFMADDLIAMGMPTAFTDAADFSGMDGKKDLYISDVIHQAFVDVNEEGTEAAAATAVVMKNTAIANPTIFNADHPFIFLIQEKETGNFLFMGRVTDPTK